MFNNTKGQSEMFGAIIVVIIVVAILAVFIGIRTVQYNTYAYEVEFGKLRPELKDPGLNWIGIGHLDTVNNQVRAYNIHVAAASKDMQDVTFDVNINSRLKKDESYNFLRDYQDEASFTTYVNNKIQEKAKTIIYKYNAKEILDNRLALGIEIKGEVQKIPELKYFEIDDVALANIDYSDEYKKAIEEKARLDIEKDIIVKQGENLVLQKKNMDSIDIDKYFKWTMINKWDGKSALIIGGKVLE